jgi:hypothetical protein
MGNWKEVETRRQGPVEEVVTGSLLATLPPVHHDVGPSLYLIVSTMFSLTTHSPEAMEPSDHGLKPLK